MSAAARVVICGVGGVGRALAVRLAAAGQPVHLVARDAGKLAALSSALGSAPYTVADAADPAAFEAAMAGLAADGVPTRGLVYAIGSIPLKPLRATTAHDFAAAYALNTVSGALALKALAPALATGNGAAPGAAVLFSTVAAALGFPNHAAIAAAKGGLEAFVRAAGAELAPRVRVNAIAPSLADTPLAARFTGGAARAALAGAHPLPRLGTAEELAGVAAFLLDDAAAGWVSGQVWAVDGGRSTLRPKN